MHQCRRLIDDLLTSTNPDGSLKYPDGLFTSEIKEALDPSWGWGDIGAALNCAPLAPKKAGEHPVILMGLYRVQRNGYAAKKWTAVTADNPYVTQSLMENVRVAETMIKKAVNHRLRPALKAMLYSRGDTDDLPLVDIHLDAVLTNIKLAKQAGDEKAKRLKAERGEAKAHNEAAEAKAKLAAVEAELAAIKATLSTD
jgi:hypothetical protein